MGQIPEESVMIRIVMIMLLASAAQAETQFLVNGKVVAPDAAAMAATDSKNNVLKCDKVVLKINSKGAMGLKKADTTGDWTPIKK